MYAWNDTNFLMIHGVFKGPGILIANTTYANTIYIYMLYIVFNTFMCLCLSGKSVVLFLFLHLVLNLNNTGSESLEAYFSI